MLSVAHRVTHVRAVAPAQLLRDFAAPRGRSLANGLRDGARFSAFGAYMVPMVNWYAIVEGRRKAMRATRCWMLVPSRG